MSGKDLTEALRTLTEQAQGADSGPPAMKTRGIAGKARSSALLGGSSGNGGGIASPLTETSFAARQFWAGGFTTTDGLFTLPAIKQITTTDATGTELIINFAEPT